MKNWFQALVAGILVLLLAGCASAPTSSTPAPQREAPAASPAASPVAERAANAAVKQIGTRYRLGGATPDAGFDCSGLVQYSYRQAGLTVPRNTEQQRDRAVPVPLASLRAGDLLFFNQEGKKYGHVGIYVGRGMFVHAPSSGTSVRSDRVESAYWKKHLTETRRVAQ